ncbi:MAG: ATP synthase F1 subunit delta [Candidatus Dependentiae bacterium]|nr:ATP synthase F1 subunit delta [Candidatus Dependentiae bacterium]
MIKAAEYTVSKRYATAFLNVFGDSISYADMQNVCAASEFFYQHKNLLFFLTWPVIDTGLKVRALNEALQKFSLGKPFDRLIDLLATHKRTYLIHATLKALCALYKQRNRIMDVAITSSNTLREQDLKALQEFLVNITGQSIIYTYKIDKNLIAGIRLQSDTVLWEYSIRKHLAHMKLPLIR